MVISENNRTTYNSMISTLTFSFAALQQESISILISAKENNNLYVTSTSESEELYCFINAANAACMGPSRVDATCRCIKEWGPFHTDPTLLGNRLLLICRIEWFSCCKGFSCTKNTDYPLACKKFECNRFWVIYAHDLKHDST